MDNNMDGNTDSVPDLTASRASILQATTAPKSRNAGPSEDVLSQALTPEVLGHETVKLFVGPKRKEFTVHKDLICARSDFFSKAFNGNFSEGEENQMYLPEDDPGAFADLIDYIYRRTLPENQSRIPKSHDGNSGETPHVSRRSLLMRYIRLYSLAEKYCMWDLSNKVISALPPSIDNRPINLGTTIRVAKAIYRKTTESSKLRSYCALISAIFLQTSVLTDAGHLSSSQVEKSTENFQRYCPKDLYFFADLFNMQMKYREDFRNYKSLGKLVCVINICDFHVHPDGKRCKEVTNLIGGNIEGESKTDE